MENIKRLIKSYESWVAANPETVGDVETTTKWISYFIAGRISNSTVVSELMYSLSNIMVLYNDRIIDKQGNSEVALGCSANNGVCYRLKFILTTLEYCEVFIEISAKRIFGVRGKWFFVVFLQVFKAAGRFYVLKNSTEAIITTPAIPILNRREFVKQQNANNAIAASSNSSASNIEPASASFTFQLKRSGRVMRKVEGAPPLQLRDLKLQQDIFKVNNNKGKLVVPRALLQAEYLYIAKPLLHLASMGIFGGEKRWQQYVVALTIDLASIRIYYNHRHIMNKQQELEMSRRCVNLLLYMMRSPFYERFTKNRLERFLIGMMKNRPLLKMITNPLLEYIPHWQNTYFYLWST